MKKHRVVLLSLAALLIVIATTLAIVYRSQSNGLRRECPDEWIENRMPTIGNEGEVDGDQYFIFDGERRELKDYDVEWIEANCSVQIQYVY